MDPGRQQHRSQIFILRLWAEDLGEGQAEWRGHVQHVISGEAHYFREWPALIAWLATMLPATQPQTASHDRHEAGDST